MRTLILATLLGALTACQSTPKKDDDAQSGVITPGTVKMTIVKGRTSQSQILETFGPPDVVTHKDDQQVWTYDKTTYDYETRGGYLTVILAGQSTKSVKSGSRSNFLMVYFDNADIVTDYRYNSVKY